MWAAIKSDLREFATGAAEETNAASEKVVGKKIIPADVNGAHADAKALADGVGNVMGGAIRGLVVVSNMVGGIVAPRSTTSDISVTNRCAINNNNNNNMVTTTTTTTPPPPSAPVSMALSSMLAAVAAGEEDDEEEEMGWDDDDDDIHDDDVDDLDTQANDDREGGAQGVKRMDTDASVTIMLGTTTTETSTFNDVEMPIAEGGATVSAAALYLDNDNKALMVALQNKLASVEKSRIELQSEHRRQTAELVELRSKVEEYERQQQQQSADLLQKQQLDDDDDNDGGKDEQIRDLQLQVEQLKSPPLKQVEVLKQEHKEYVTLILREKGELDRELSNERQRNEDLMRQNTAFVDEQKNTITDKDIDKAKELLLHQNQVDALEMNLSSLQTNLDTTTCELLYVKEQMTNQVLVHQEEIQRQLAITNDIKETLLRTKEEYKNRIVINESKVIQTESETQTDSSVTTPPLNVSPDDTASEDTVISTIPQDAAASADGVVDDNKNNHSSFSTANEELLEAGAPSPSPSSGSSPAIKVDITEDELSDDWGDGGW